MKTGYTLIETLVTVLVMLVLVMFGLISFAAFHKQTALDIAVQQLISNIQLVRSKSVGSEFQEQYGIHFAADSYVLFQGAAYNPSHPSNKTVIIDPLEFHSISLGGGSDVVFDRVTGTTQNTGTVGIRDKNNYTISDAIGVYASGVSGRQSAVAPVGSRITDSRHIHFDLPGSIQNAVTLRLLFLDSVNGDVQYDIAMADYFNTGKTDFRWEGTVNVHGQNQTLVINTHMLDGFDTILSIHRDRRFNTKGVVVSIDGNGIATYAANGTPTVGAFGGTMTVQ